jgi:4-hydroxyphenylacetate 3-monooxygenase
VRRGSASKFGEWWVPNKQFVYAAQVPHTGTLSAIRRELSGGALIMLPSSISDFGDPMLKKVIHTTQRAASMQSEAKVKFLKAAWDAVESEFGSRHTEYGMFYAGARFVTADHSLRTYDWKSATDLVDSLVSSYELADEFGSAETK